MADYSVQKPNHFDARIMDDCKEDIMWDEYERYREEKAYEEEQRYRDYEERWLEGDAYDTYEEPWERYPDNYNTGYGEDW